MNPIRPIVEDDVILQQRAGLALAVNAVVQIVGASIVVGDGAVDLSVTCLQPDVNPARARVMDDHIDKLGPGPSGVDAKCADPARIGVHDLKSPKPGVRTSDDQELRNRRALTRRIAHHDGSGGRTGQITPVAAVVRPIGVRSAAQPDRAARRHTGRAVESGR